MVSSFLDEIQLVSWSKLPWGDCPPQCQEHSGSPPFNEGEKDTSISTGKTYKKGLGLALKQEKPDFMMVSSRVSWYRCIPPKSSILSRILHYKPSILGYHHLWKPSVCLLCNVYWVPELKRLAAWPSFRCQGWVFAKTMTKWRKMTAGAVKVPISSNFPEFKWIEATKVPKSEQKLRWAVVEIPLSFHYPGWFIGIPLLDL